MSRFAPPSEEELAARGIGPLKFAHEMKTALSKQMIPSTPDINEAWEEAPAKKKRGRPAKAKGLDHGWSRSTSL